MKDKNLNKGIEELKKLALSSQDKQNVLEHISLYADENPVHTKTTKLIKSPFTNWTMLLYRKVHFAYSVVALFLIVIMGVGTAAAAEKALPGDLLYPVKIKITEPVKGAFKVTPEAKVKWESEKALKRLEEAEKLAEKGELNGEKRMKVEEEFEKSKNAFIKKVDEKKLIKEAKKEIKKESKKDEEDLKEKIKIKGDDVGVIQTNREEKIEDKKEEKDEREKRFEIDVEDRLEKISEKKQALQEDQQNEIDNLEKSIKEKVNFSKDRKLKD